MLCSRCTGLSVPELIVEGGTRIFAMRCLHCGDVTDLVIRMNRHRHQRGQLGRARTSIEKNHRPTRRNPPSLLNIGGMPQD